MSNREVFLEQQSKVARRILGVMSGSSLDGVDLAGCSFYWEEGKLRWRIEVAETIPFSDVWHDRLAALAEQTGEVVAQTHVYFGRYLAELINAFLEQHRWYAPDLIASHGHTVYHNPDSRFTFQIGDGGTLAALTGIDVASDFRMHDVALDGEGAPLAPLADKWLFPDYDIALNIGGIANMSYSGGTQYRAGDVTAANQVLNSLSFFLGEPFDNNGHLAASGQIIPGLLDRLNALAFFDKPFPKSLSNREVQQQFLPLFVPHTIMAQDALRTAVEHIVVQVDAAAKALSGGGPQSGNTIRALVTGGGARNGFLIQRLRDVCDWIQWEVPDVKIVDFKEALLMALLGLWRLEGRTAGMQSVTGAKRDYVAGALYAGRLNNKSTEA